MIARKTTGIFAGLYVLLSFLCGDVAMAQEEQQKKPIRLIFNAEDKQVFPFWMGEGATVRRPNGGVTYELLRMIDAEIPEIEIVYQRFPWRRCQQNLRKGKADAIIGSFNTERLKIGVFPSRDGQLDTRRYISQEQYCLYRGLHTALSWDGDGFSATRDITVSVPRGYSIIPFLNEHHLNVHEVESTDLAMTMLANGRVDGAISTCRQIEAVLARRKTVKDNVVANPVPLSIRNYYIILSKQFVRAHPVLSERIWDVSRQISDAHHDALLRYYMQYLNK